MLEDQDYMRENVNHFVNVIKEEFLGDQWQILMNNVFEAQQFRKRGFGTESPQAFITHRTIYTRMLTQINNGGIQKINIVMRKAPIVWRPILNMLMIQISKQLLAQVIEHSKALILTARTDAGTSRIQTDDLIIALKSLEIETPRHSRFLSPRSANIVEKLVDNEDAEPLSEVDLNYTSERVENNDDQSKLLLKSAFQNLKKKQCPLPKQYYFLMSDKETQLGQPPPSPCKVCRSPKHWDKKCPYWDKYLERIKKKNTQLASLQLEEMTSPQNAY
ncbi:hypothetical protein EV421DRAFT_1913707 [Armillaria borealis]|uniref:Uncharacterized protein n=1 Tax=Armillaria borealis TaxID=47425 RepID=A0AA39IVX2_9AGAR|nr:hypothetical protein EV421DRAFT_1913707 [Armillaria borealis]